MRTHRRRHRGQSALEFAMVAPLYFMMVFGICDAGLWTLENLGATSAADSGVRLAAAAPKGQPASPVSAANSHSAFVAIGPALQSTMVGTTVEEWIWPGPGPAPNRCPSAEEVRLARGVGHVVVCAVQRADFVTVSIVGYLSSFVPAASAFGFVNGGIPMNVTETVHTLIFHP